MPLRPLLFLLLSLMASPLLAKPACQLMFDAGSSGTRLFLFQQKGGQLVSQRGPKIAALADPVRGIGGKTAEDIPATAMALAKALEDFRHDGPAGEGGKPRWRGFDWRERCRLQAVSVLATAGMRLAEQEAPGLSQTLWLAVRQQLQLAVGPKVQVEARTLSGFEEGLYAWLARYQKRQRSDFGIVEMGGASSQVAFPCPACSIDDDALHQVMISGKAVPFYSYSFLGLGQDLAPGYLGLPDPCRFGAGKGYPQWRLSQCQAQLLLTQGPAIRDPANYQGGIKGTERQVPVAKADVDKWYLTGAFKYLEADQVASCCQGSGQCYQPETACFRAAYLPLLLEKLGVPATAKVKDRSWTLGAALCRQENCLAKAGVLACRWSKNGCL